MRQLDRSAFVFLNYTFKYQICHLMARDLRRASVWSEEVLMSHKTALKNERNFLHNLTCRWLSFKHRTNVCLTRSTLVQYTLSAHNIVHPVRLRTLLQKSGNISQIRRCFFILLIRVCCLVWSVATCPCSVLSKLQPIFQMIWTNIHVLLTLAQFWSLQFQKP